MKFRMKTNLTSNPKTEINHKVLNNENEIKTKTKPKA